MRPYLARITMSILQSWQGTNIQLMSHRLYLIIRNIYAFLKISKIYKNTKTFQMDIGKKGSKFGQYVAELQFINLRTRKNSHYLKQVLWVFLEFFL